MRGEDLLRGRKHAGLTQVEAARKLRVSQPYLSLLERGDRSPTVALARRATKLYRLSPTKLPVTLATTPRPAVDPDQMARELAALGYPGFAYMRGGRQRNPAEVLFCGLAQDNLEPRLTEALPWVLLRYEDLDWKWLVSAAKQHDLQNRLGFVTSFAVRAAESDAVSAHKVPLLKKFEEELRVAKLAKEDTLCRESMSKTERVWLQEVRPAEAKEWNLLTDLSPAKVKYAHA